MMTMATPPDVSPHSLQIFPSFTTVYFFGRFNFPHVGYLYVIRETLQQLAPKDGITIVFSESQTTWEKQAIPVQHRRQMFELAIASGCPELSAQIHFSTIESDIRARLGSAYGGYTIDTLREFERRLGPQPRALVMGADAALGIPGHHAGFTAWKDWQTILQSTHLIIVPRGRYATSQDIRAHLDAQLSPYLDANRIHILTTHPQEQELHASSSAIEAGAWQYLLPDVARYAQDHGLLI